MRSTFVNLALSVASLALGFVLTEAFLLVRYPVGSTIYRTDGRVLYKLVGGARRLFTPLPGNGTSVIVKVDGRGYRGEGFSEPRRGPRVVVYGDSFVEAAYSPVGQTFVARLQLELRSRLQQPELEVINAGVAGYGPDQAALRIEDELDGLAPDLVLLCVFSGNDFGDLLRNKLFRLGDHGELLENRPALGNELKKAFEDARRNGRKPAVLRALGTIWATMGAPAPPTSFPNYIEEALALRKKEYDDYIHNVDVVNNVFADGYDADIAVEPTSPAAQLKRELMAGVLARVDRVLRADNVPWLLVVIPDPVDVASSDFELQVDERKHPSYDSRRLTTVLIDAAHSLNLAYVDLFEPLSETEEERLFFRHGDNHWNAAGQSKAAAAVAGTIARQAIPVSSPALSASR